MFSVFLATIGIMSAMPQEADSILNAMTEKITIHVGSREFIQGNFEGIPVVFSLAGIGKVSAAMTATLLIEKFKVSEIIFTGVAGGGEETEVGDIVIGHTYLQHDLDLRPIAPLFYMYSLGKQTLEADQNRVLQMKTSANRFLSKGISFPELGITEPKVHEGVIVSGDQFIGSLTHHQEILEKTKEVLPKGFHAVEMEGAAVAQVCTELQVPFTVLRTISDKANDAANVDFLIFMDLVARHYSLGILKEYFQEIRKDELNQNIKSAAIEYVHLKDAIKHSNSANCIVYEYPMENAELNIGVAELTSRYPDQGYAINHKCSEIGYVLKGSGSLVTETKEIELSPGDVVYIPHGEKYYWKGTMTVILPSTPAWHPEQHQIILEEVFK